MSLSSSPHEDVDVHDVYEPSHRKYVKPFNQTSSVGLDPYDDVKNLPLAIEVRGPISLLLSCVFSLVLLLCSLFLSLKPLYYGNSSFIMSVIFIKKQ